jgi:hypothetical protein
MSALHSFFARTMAVLVFAGLGACGYTCPPGNPLGRFGCHVPCEDLPSLARSRCAVIAADAERDARADAADDATDRDVVPFDVADAANADAVVDNDSEHPDALTFVDGDVADSAEDSAQLDGSLDGDGAIGDSSPSMIDPTIEPPRAIAPMATSTVSSHTPTLRWTPTAGTDGAIVELSRTRAFSTISQTLRVTASSARPTTALTPGVWFWRLRGTVSARTAEGTRNSAVWSFRVRATNATGGADTHYGVELDVNGDGFSDVAVGATGGNGGRGRVDVYFGSATGLATMPSVSLGGATADERFGSSVAAAGDVNGDGFGDLLVGASSAAPGARNGAGAASLFLGSAAGLASPPQRVIYGALAGDRLGSSVSAAGDVNGDGYGDVAIGAFSATIGGRAGAGSVSIFHGSATGITAVATRTLSGPAAGDFFGWAISSGDVNGDGFSDIVVGAPSTNAGAMNNAGAFMVWHGSMTGIGASPSRTVFGGAAFDFLGRSVTAGGDFNNDGYSDVTAGANAADVGGRANCGSVSIFVGGASGTSAAALRTLAGTAAEDSFGWSSSVADVNGDGFSDLIVGAYRADGAQTDSGSAFVFHGEAAGLSATIARRLDGAAFLDEFAFVVAGVADVNGDGFGDVVIGANAADAGSRRDVGAASLFLGGTSGVGSTATRTLVGTLDDERFGSSLALRLAPRRQRFVMVQQPWRRPGLWLGRRS